MKRLVAYLMCICSLFMSSITVFAQGESSVSITNNEIADKAATLLTSIQGESTYYGMENVDFSKLYLGQEIPVYKFSENGYERTEVKAFPVLEDTKCVSIVYCSIDANNNELILGIGGNLAEKFENVNLEKGVALIVKNGNVQVYQENATLASYDGNGIVQVSNVLNEKCYLQIGPLTRASKNLNVPLVSQTSVYKGYKQDKIEMRGDRAEMSDFPLYLNMVTGGLDCRDQAIGGFSFVVKIYAVPVVEIIG